MPRPAWVPSRLGATAFFFMLFSEKLTRQLPLGPSYLRVPVYLLTGTVRKNVRWTDEFFEQRTVKTKSQYKRTVGLNVRPFCTNFLRLINENTWTYTVVKYINCLIKFLFRTFIDTIIIDAYKTLIFFSNFHSNYK